MTSNDDTAWRQLLQASLTAHESRLERLDRNYAKMLEIAADIAHTNDRIDDQLLRHIRLTQDSARRHHERLTLLEDVTVRQQASLERLDALAARQQLTLDRIDVTLAAILDLLRRPQNGHETP
jgi:uncharacterized coiled-coil protein SlyX